MKQCINLLSLIKREVRFMLIKNMLKYLLVSLLFICIGSITAYKTRILNPSTSINFFFEIFKGINYFENFQSFKFPIFWFLCNVLIIFMVQAYMEDDLKVNCIYIMSRSGRTNYWIVKILVSIISVLIYYMIVFGIIFAIGAMFFSDGLNIDLMIIILYIITSTTLVLINMCLSLKINYRYSFLIIICILVLSIFFDIQLLPGQHSLILRHIPYCNEGGLTILFSVIYNILLSALSSILGLRVIKKKDIY